MDLLELRRLVFLQKNTVSKERQSKRPRFTPMSAPVRSKAVIVASRHVTPGIRRLIDFIELIDKLGTVPWANQRSVATPYDIRLAAVTNCLVSL